MEDKLHLIGEADRPIYVCKKGEIKDLFTSEFYRIYDVWLKFNAGLGLPFCGTWMEQNPDLINCVVAMENHFKQTFSFEQVLIKYQEAIINRLGSIAEILSKRGRR